MRLKILSGKRGGRAALETGAIEGDAIAALGPRLTGRMILPGRVYPLLQRQTCRNKRCPVLRQPLGIERAMLGRRAERRLARSLQAQIPIHHGAVVLAVAAAAGGQVRLRVGSSRVQQRDGIKRSQQRKHQDGGKAAHVGHSLHAGGRPTQLFRFPAQRLLGAPP